MNEQIQPSDESNSDSSNDLILRREETLRSQAVQPTPSSDKPKAPVMVRILAILMMLIGVSSMAYLIYFSMLAATQALNYPWLTRITLFIFAAVLMAAAWGLRNMKKWGLYFFVSWLAAATLIYFFDTISIHNSTVLAHSIGSVIINGSITAYLIVIRDKFEPDKPRNPKLIAAMIILVLLLLIMTYFALAEFKKAQEIYLQTQEFAQTQPPAEWDQTINANVSMIGTELDIYFLNHSTYAGFSAQNTDVGYKAKDINEQGCKTSMKIDISPDGKKFVIHEPLCSDQQKSACVENGMNEATTASTATVEKNYSCK